MPVTYYIIAPIQESDGTFAGRYSVINKMNNDRIVLTTDDVEVADDFAFMLNKTRNERYST